GYGRIVRDARGRVKAIVEQSDATAAQRRIDECNTGVLVVRAAQLRGWLGKLRSNNAQGEYYLTDIIGLAGKDGVAVRALAAPGEVDVLGVNDRVQLARLESELRARHARAALLAGATLADPARFEQRGTLTLGSDVFIDINVVFEGRVVLGDGV